MSSAELSPLNTEVASRDAYKILEDSEEGPENDQEQLTDKSGNATSGVQSSTTTSLNDFYNTNSTPITSAAEGVASTDHRTVENAISSFSGTSKVVIDELDALSTTHPFVKVAAVAFERFVAGHSTKRNNQKVLAVKIQMQEMMRTLFQLRQIKDLDGIGPDSAVLKDLMQPLMIQIANDIKECGALCDVYLKKSVIAKFLKAKMYEDRLAAYAAKFMTYKDQLDKTLTIYIALGINAVNAKLNMQSSQLELTEGKLDMVTSIFQMLDAPREKGVTDFIQADEASEYHCWRQWRSGSARGSLRGNHRLAYSRYPLKIELLAQSQRANIQMIMDFLADELGRQDILESNFDKRRILHFLTKLAKSTQIFPKCTELSGVGCNLTNPVNDEGGYGFIYKGVFRNQAVCIKAVRVIGSGTKAAKMLRAQASETVLLAHVSHPNVIPLYGTYLSAEQTPRLCIVSPWMENGDLTVYLQKFPDTPKIPLASDMAAGLGFLHDMGIIHADLKARNVLVSRSHRAVLADFGIATILHINVGTTTAGDFSGTTYWMAPELLVALADDQPPPPTKESDVWGFACICYEMFTGEIPFIDHYRPMQLAMAFAKGRRITPLRPNQDKDPISTDVDNEPWVALVERCWNLDPSKRPNAADALQFLTDLNVQDNRPSMDEELAMFKAIKDSRVRVEIDYSRVLSMVQND